MKPSQVPLFYNGVAAICILEQKAKKRSNSNGSTKAAAMMRICHCENGKKKSGKHSWFSGYSLLLLELLARGIMGKYDGLIA